MTDERYLCTYGEPNVCIQLVGPSRNVQRSGCGHKCDHDFYINNEQKHVKQPRSILKVGEYYILQISHGYPLQTTREIFYLYQSKSRSNSQKTFVRIKPTTCRKQKNLKFQFKMRAVEYMISFWEIPTRRCKLHDLTKK